MCSSMNALRRSLNSEQRGLGSKSMGLPPPFPGRCVDCPCLSWALGSLPMSQQGASYRAAGVDYDALDAGKRLAMAKALSTSSLLEGRGGRPLDASRGDPAFVFELGEEALAFVVEGLGTKSIIARHVLEGQSVNRFA